MTRAPGGTTKMRVDCGGRMGGKRCLKRLAKFGHLKKAGTDKSKLLTTTIYITDMKTFPEMNAVWDAWVSPGNTPARATVEAKLAGPQYHVEIMVVAAK